MKENQHIEEKNWELLAKSIYDQNTDSTADVSAYETIFSDEKEHGQLLKTTRQVDLYFELNKYQANPAWEKVASRIHQPSANKQPILRTLLISPLFRIASVLIFAALLMVAGYEVFYSPESTGKILEVSSTNQILNTFALPDGTLVSLNTNTKIKYPEKFGRKIREVSIEGEAFFEVKPNKNKPFIIHAGKAQIKVLGTSFNVSAYPTTKQVEVIVETGKVQVLNKNTETIKTNELILTPGDKGTLVYSDNSLLKTTNQNPNFLAWKTRNLTFKATSLNEVIGNLEKVYNVNIRLANPKLNELLLTAQFNDYSLDFILKVIENTFQLEAKKINGQYILKARS